MRKARLIHNPIARNAPSRERLLEAVSRAEGWEIDVVATEAAGHGVSLAREAAEGGAEVVFACGGDGTINEVVNGLAGTPGALAVLRGGMGDVFAREMHIPRRPEQALPLLLSGERRRFDLGIANDRLFLLMASAGFDAQVVKVVPPRAKQRLGSTSYALWGARTLLGYRPRKVKVVADGVPREVELFWLLLGNTRSYGGVLNITSTALVDDGLLDAYVFDGHGLNWAARTGIRLALHQQGGAKGVTFRLVRELSIETPGLPVQADGEYVGETPMRFGVAPQAIDVMLPPGCGLELFGNPRQADGAGADQPGESRT